MRTRKTLSTWAIYALVDPRKPGVFRYVGYTSKSWQDRLTQHISSVKTKKRNTYRDNWIDSLLKEGIRPYVLPLEIGEGEGWQESEKKWIAFSRECGFNLTNTAEGGLGGSGVSPSEENRRATSERHKGNKYNLGRKTSDETKRKLSIAGKGRTKSEETRIRLSKSLKGKLRPYAPKNSPRKPIRCVETGVTYESAIEAMRQNNLSTGGNLARAVKNGRLYAGFHWEAA